MLPFALTSHGVITYITHPQRIRINRLHVPRSLATTDGTQALSQSEEDRENQARTCDPSLVSAAGAGVVVDADAEACVVGAEAEATLAAAGAAIAFDSDILCAT
jgi:hypothetical protein